MNDEPLIRFAVLFFAGIGLMVTGALNLLLRESGIARRVLIASVVWVGVVIFAASFAGIRSLQTGLMLIAVVGPMLAFASDRGRRFAGEIVNLLSRPSIAWGTCLAIGLGASLFAAVRYETEDRAAVDLTMAELEVLVRCAGEVSAEPSLATTDQGRPVMLFGSLAPRSTEELQSVEDAYFRVSGRAIDVIRREPSDDRSNCHGWVFAAGRYRIDGNDVEFILRDNGYVETSAPKTGDLAIYRKDGWIEHTAVVRYIVPDMPVLVEGKWEATGTYLHPVDKSPYGQRVSYYRSPRKGHLLAGLDAK
jgi:hypothetical protein